MMEHFTWRGEPIEDIHVWAAARGERMVKYHAERDASMVIDGECVFMKETQDGEMPESFWNGLAMMHGWHYTEVSQ